MFRKKWMGNLKPGDYVYYHNTICRIDYIHGDTFQLKIIITNAIWDTLTHKNKVKLVITLE